MDASRKSDGFRAPDPEWVAGYEAAIEDAMRLIDSMGGPAFSNFSSPVLVHLKARLAELRRGGRQGAA